MRRSAAAVWALGATVGMTSHVSAWAQGVEEGRVLYLSTCAACHGADGKGDGPMSGKLKPKPANLTLLAKSNKGVFSPAKIHQRIDGRETTGVHRSTEMPVWGCRHESAADARRKARKKKELDSFLDLPCDPESVIQNRIRSVVQYLQGIQEK